MGGGLAPAPGAPAPQDPAAELLKKLSEGDQAEQEAAADALVKRGSSSRASVAKAWDKAPAPKKLRFEDVLLRLDAGTDLHSAQYGEFSIGIQEASFLQEITPDQKAVLRVRAVFDGRNDTASPVLLTLAKATLYSARDRMGMLVRGSKGEAFARTYDPRTPRMFDYVALIPPRFDPGTRAVATFEVEVAGVRKLIRTQLLTIGKKE